MTTDAARSQATRLEWTVAILLAIGTGMLALSLSEAPTRWFVVYLGAAFLFPIVLALREAHALHLGLMVFSLQAYMCLTLLPDDTSSYVGRSGPAGLEIHIQALLAGAALLARWSEVRTRGLRLGGEVVVPFLLMIATLVLTTLANRERSAGLFVLAIYAQCYLVYVATMNLVTSERLARYVVGAVLLTAIVQSCVYFLEYATHTTFTLTGEVIDRSADLLQRHGGTVSTHPSGFAEFMNLLAMVSVMLYLATPSPVWRRRAVTAAVFGTAAVLLTLTRAAWIGFVLAAVVGVVVGTGRRWLSPGAITTMAVAGLLLLVLFAQPIAGVFQKEHTEDFDERATLAQMAFSVIEARPIRGVGPGAYGNEFRNYVGGIDTSKQWLFIVHNHYLLRWAESGIFGLIGLLWFLWTAIRMAWRSMDARSGVTSRLGLGVVAGFVAVYFQFWFDIGNASCVHFAMWFLLGLLEALRRLEQAGVVVSFEDHAGG